QRPVRPGLVQVLDDGHGLAHDPVAMQQHRHQLLRIEVGEGRLVLLAAVLEQVHRHHLVGQLLEVERDADPIGGAGPPVRVQPDGAGIHAASPLRLDPRRDRRAGPSIRPPARASPCPGANGGITRGPQALAIFCSMAPKMLRPSPSSISMRTTSPKRMKGVLGLPSRRVSTVRCSAKQLAPLLVSSLATVPEPTMVPATSGRVFAACATSWAKSNCMSTPASGAPNHLPLMWVSSGRCTLLPRQAAPSSSGVTNTGLRAERGLDCRKPKPLASSAGIRLRRLTS